MQTQKIKKKNNNNNHFAFLPAVQQVKLKLHAKLADEFQKLNC